MDKEHTTLPFEGTLPSEKTALNLLVTEETGKKRILLKSVGTETQNLNAKQEVESKLSNLVCLKLVYLIHPESICTQNPEKNKPKHTEQL